MEAQPAILDIQCVSRHYGGVKAVEKLDLQVQKGQILGVIGPNGAGKTTLFNLITGMDVPSGGKIRLALDTGLRANSRSANPNNTWQEIQGQKPHTISRCGIARTFQNIRLFGELSVLENIMLGTHYQEGSAKNRFFCGLLSLLHHKKTETHQLEKSIKWLEFFQLMRYRSELASSLPYGKQRELEIARALSTGPKLLFLDEPAAGMNPSETGELMQNIRRINQLGITIVLIEHDMHLVMKICEHIVVLDQGEKIAEGAPEQIRQNPRVISAYLGQDYGQDAQHGS